MAIIPTIGHTGIADAIVNAGSWHLAIGIGTAAEAAANTALSSEITTGGGERADVTPTHSDNVITWTHQWTFSDSFTVTEIGLLNAGVDGDLVIRHKYASSQAVASGDKLTATLTMTC